jgi:putative Holliday junction resolvase
MRVLGIDPGTRRIGVALSDELGLIALPLATLERGSEQETIDRLLAALGGKRPRLAVVGLPLRLDGSEGGAARQARQLAALIEARLDVEIELWDERMTSVQAERLLAEAGLSSKARRGPTDRVAAAIILQSFLDAHPERCRRNER